MTRIESGSGNGNEAKVGNDLRLYTQGISESEARIRSTTRIRFR
jgi:hypothetical protein